MARKFNRLIVGLLVVAFILYRLKGNAADYDLWGYLAFGRLFWESNGFPYHDPFSYLPTKSLWVYHEWLTGTIYYPIYKTLGGAGLQFLRFFLAVVTAWIMYLTSRKRGASSLACLFGLFIGFGYVLSTGYSPVRAQIFTYLFFAFTIYVLETTRIEKRWHLLWWLVPIQILWCNLHGGFVAGLGVIFIYALGELLSKQNFRPYVKVFPIAALGTLINPYGLNYWVYLYDAITMPRPAITEWATAFASVKSETLSGNAILFFIIFSFAAILILWYRRYSLTVMVLISVTAFLGFRHLRHIQLFMVVLGIVIPEAFAALFLKFENHPWKSFIERYTRPWMLSLTALMITACFAHSFLSSSPLDMRVRSWQETLGKSPYFPVDAFEYIARHHLRGNILPLFDWGEYLIWAFHPDLRVGMDGRYETVYPNSVCKEYFQFVYGQEKWRDFLLKYEHDLIFIKSNSKIHDLLKKEPGWVEEYCDSTAALFSKEILSQDKEENAY